MSLSSSWSFTPRAASGPATSNGSSPLATWYLIHHLTAVEFHPPSPSWYEACSAESMRSSSRPDCLAESDQSASASSRAPVREVDEHQNQAAASTVHWLHASLSLGACASRFTHRAKASAWHRFGAQQHCR